MSINGFAKAGWFLVGLGVGIFSTTLIMKKELDKPIGEIEEYIPLEDREDFEFSKDILENGEDIENDTETGSYDESDSRNGAKGSRHNTKDISERRRSSRQSGRGQSGHNNREKHNSEFSSNQNDILDYYRSSNKDATRPESRSVTNKHGKKFEEQRGRGSKNQSTRYSKMYQEQDIEQAIHAVNSKRGSRDSYSVTNSGTGVDLDESYYEDDSPLDDDYAVSPVYDSDLHDEFTLERVEENIEIFLDDNPQDFITMIFYEGDKTLCDDGEQIVPNAEEVVGLAALNRLIEGGPGAENGVIFVHNLKTSLNYEIVLDAGSYKDTVMGQFESHLDRDGGKDGYS